MKGTKTFSDVLILGNGPSTKYLEARNVRYFSKTAQIIVMNDFHLSELSREISPNFYFLADPEYWRPTNAASRKSISELRVYLNEKSKIIVVQPAQEKKFLEDETRTIFFNPIPFHGFGSFNNPIGLWGLPNSVALLAICSARSWGYKSIYFAGLDATSYGGYFSNDLNQLAFSNTHNYFYSREILDKPQLKDFLEPRIISDPTLRNMVDVLHSSSIFLWHQNRLLASNGVNIGNDQNNFSSPRACLICPENRYFT